MIAKARSMRIKFVWFLMRKDYDKRSEDWARMLRGEHPVARFEARLHRMLPTNPRCKICFVPFGGMGGRLFSILGRRPWTKNPTMCNTCQSYAEKHPGGAEVELAMLFADVRGSTTIAEGITPAEYNKLLNRFFKSATDVLIDHAAWIDKFVGDEVIAFFFPNSVPGTHHARVGLDAARDLLRATKGGPLPIGIGVHAGSAYVGTVGDDNVSDVTAVGNDVNVAARLASSASAHTIVASEIACIAAGLKDDGSPRRELELKGMSSTVPVRILRG